MLKRALVWAAGNSRLQKQATENAIGRRVAHRFVAGERLDEALAAAAELNSSGIGGILDLLGEGVTDLPGASQAVAEYEDAVKAIAARGLDDLDQAVAAGADGGPGRLRREPQRDPGPGAGRRRRRGDRHGGQQPGLGHPRPVPGRGGRAPADAAGRPGGAAAHAAGSGGAGAADAAGPPGQGAYREPVELAQQGKAEIQAQYKFLTDWLFRYGGDPAFGTHDGELIDYARQTAAEAGKAPKEFEIQMLYGIRRNLQQELVADGYRVRVYIPYGSAWYPYLTRRMAERPANLLFFLRALAGK
jgi:proline dehydrogenase